MFNIDNRHRILISRGDSAEFSLFLNQGTMLEPVSYTFSSGRVICVNINNTTVATRITKVTVIATKWLSKITVSGTYNIVFVNNEWVLNSITIDPDEYGLVITGQPQACDTITVTSVSATADYIEFYLKYINSRDYLICKKITVKGDIITKYNKNGTITETVSTGNMTVDADGDMIIKLTVDDTTFVPPGDYHYYIKAYLTDDNGVTQVSTVTPKYSLTVEG